MANPTNNRFPKILVLNKQRRFRILAEPVASFSAGILQALGRQELLLTVVFVGVRKMAILNRQFRARNYATDVLSFHYDEDLGDEGRFLGEVVIAPQVACEQADRWRRPRERELRTLIVHGILHLLGHDHETDKGEMGRLQKRLVRSSAIRRIAPIAELGERT